MRLIWLQAVIDIPAVHFDEASRFWASVSNSAFGEIHPDHDEFVPLRPTAGDMHLELQRIDEGQPSVHLDLAVDDIAAWTNKAIDCGATLVAAPGHSVLRTPGGVPFCIVPGASQSSTETEDGSPEDRDPGAAEWQLPAAIDDDVEHGVDQICIDVVHDRFDLDVEFWSALTGWSVNPAQLDEFRSFDQPRHLPFRLLLQRLGASDPGPSRAHLDISCGDHRNVIAARHLAAGATEIATFEYWTALRDPAGLPYCVTTRPLANTQARPPAG